MSDSIANMLSQISNANHKFMESIDLPASKMKVQRQRIKVPDSGTLRRSQPFRGVVIRTSPKRTSHESRHATHQFAASCYPH